MSGSREVALGKCCEVVGGGTPKTAEPSYWGGEIPWATPKDLGELDSGYIDATARQITPAGLDRSGARLLPAGSVLLSSRAPIGLVAINRVPMATNQGFKSLIPGAEVHAEYLARWLDASKLRLQHMGNGATFKEVSKAVVERIVIPLPSPSEQRRIAAILAGAEKLRRLRRRVLAKLVQLEAATFREAFGDASEPREDRPLRSLGEMLAGSTVFDDGDWVETKDQDPEGDVRLVQLADVGDGAFLDRSSRFLTSATAARLRCTYLEPGDVLVARMPDPLGRACIYPGGAMPAITVVDVCIVRPAAGGPDPVWLASCLNSAGARRQIARRATGTTRSRISRGNLATIRLAEPPPDLQTAFRRRLERVQGLRRESEAQLAQLDSLFMSLQARAFRGEL